MPRNSSMSEDRTPSTAGGLRRGELADFLRSRRARLRPYQVGLPENGRRRTAGLRRQEVAQLAGMSVDYLIRLEQARGPRPSRQVLSALGRALMLSRDEREYLFRIAGEQPPPAAGPSRELAPAVRYLLERLQEVPAYALDAKYEILAWNRLATCFVGDLATVAAVDRNLIRWVFRQPEQDSHWEDPDTVQFARGSVADLRAAYARYPGDPGLEGLVTELLALSPRFAQMWADHEVQERRSMRKRITHPQLGPVEFDCQVLLVPDTDQRLIVYCPDPGSPTERAFRELARVAVP